jgi:hypothetical protein
MSDINVIVNDEIVNIDVIDEPVLVNVVNSPGVPGAPGVGVPVGGTTGQVLAKNSATNYDTEWVDVSGGAWGTITGTLSNQTDLQTALNGKFDDPTGTTAQYLRGDGSLATFPAIPSGTVTSVGLTMPSAFSVANSPVTSSGTLAVTGAGTTAQYIRGDGSLDTFPSLTGYVPYTGATSDVNLGTHRILAQNATISSSGSGDTATITHSSGSGIGLNITKGGNGEGLYINKTGGSGNAATIIGTINATTLVKSGGTSSQFLKADGSVDSSVYVPTSRELTINGVSYDLSANRSWTVSGGISGSGASGQVSYWDGTTSQAGSNNLFWDAANGRLGIGTNVPLQQVDILRNGSGAYYQSRTYRDSAFAGGFIFLHARGTSASPSYLLGNDRLASIFFKGYDGTTANDGNGASIESFATSNHSAGITPADLRFSTTGSGSAVTENMRLTANGRLMLQNGGTFTDSGQRLQVQGTTLLNGNVTFSSATGMTWDATNSRLGIGTNTPTAKFQVNSSTVGDIISLSESTSNTSFKVYSQSSPAGSIVFELKTNNTTTGACYTLFDGYSECWTNLVARSATSGNRWWRFGLAGATNYFAIQKLNDAATIISGTPLTIFGTGNVLLQGTGTSTTDGGQRLQVQGTTLLNGNVTFSSATGMTWDATNSRLGIGTNAPTSTLNVIGASNFNGTMIVSVNQNASTLLTVSNATSGTNSEAAYLFTSSNGSGSIGKASASKTAYKTYLANDTLIYNSTAGDISFLNDFASGAIKFAAGGSSTAYMTLHNTGNLLVGTTTNVTSSILTLASTTKGFLPPRMTNAQRTAISSPAVGLIVYCTDIVEGLYVYKSAGWTFII